jgi:hypothetical protein
VQFRFSIYVGKMAGLLIISQKEVKYRPYVTFLGKVFGTEETRIKDKIFVD